MALPSTFIKSIIYLILMPYFVNRDQLEVYYKVINPHNNQYPVILMHGYGSSLAMFEHQIPFLEKHFKIILFDAIGHGNSDKPKEELQENLLETTLRDLTDLLDKIDIESSFGIMGHSLFGCSVGLHLTHRYPNKVDFLILLNGGPIILDSTIRNVFWNLLPQFTRMHFNELPEHLIQKLIKRTIPYIVNALKPEPDEFHPTEAELFLLKEKIQYEIYEMLENSLQYIEIQCPTLIMGAELDNFAPTFMSKELKRYIPHAKVEIIAMAGHFGPAQHYDQYNFKIREFLLKEKYI